MAGADLVPTGEVLASVSGDLTRRGEDLTRAGEVRTRWGENVAVRGGNLTRRGENLIYAGEDLTRQGENITRRGEDLTRRGKELTRRGEDLAAESESSAKLHGQPAIRLEMGLPCARIRPRRIAMRVPSPITEDRRPLLAVAVGLLILFALASSAFAAEPTAGSSPEEQVAALLKTQAAAWSRGDLEAFTSIYAEDAAFLTSSGLTRGRREVLERYRKRYPDAAAMGKLTLEILEARTFPAGQDAAGVSVAARWRLEYPQQAERKTAEGLTLVVFRKVGGLWEIVQDASM
jgi:uncharacterized protein (TIGR02246 family)